MTFLSYRPSTPTPVPSSVAETIWPHGDSHRVTAVNSSLKQDGNSLSVTRECAANGFGVAFLSRFQAGLQSEFQIRLQLPRGLVCRVEVSGFATRFQRAFLEVDDQGSVMDQGDELALCCAGTTEDGGIEIQFRFRSPHTRNDWIHVLFSGTASPGASPRILGFTSMPLDMNPDFRMHQPASRSKDGVWFAAQAAFLFRNYFHFEFELARSGANLTGLELEAPVGVAGVRWLTAHPIAHDGRGLKPESSPVAPRAAALMDALGHAGELAGHQLHGLLSEPVDIPCLSMAESDRLQQFRILARFSDGHQEWFQLCPKSDEHSKLSWKCLKSHLDGMGGGRFIEVGGRGEGSAEVRRRLGPEWNYTALDIHPGLNVDVVGDAHHLSDLIPPGSADVIYSASVLEHFLAPWRFVIEANRVLRTGGLFYAAMPSAWPLHAEPWDFWRASDHAWPALLNPGTGFELLERGILGRSVILPYLPSGSGRTRAQCDPAYEHTFAIARKIGPSSASWGAYDRRWSTGRYER